MFKPKFIKEGEMLLKGVNRFINYRRDLLESDKLSKIEGLRDQLEAALKKRDASAVKEKSQQLTEICEGVGGNYRQSALAENIEVFFVAIAIAAGIRAYIAQPFKIPTGSMQPTLNGIVAHNTGDMPPNFIQRTFDRARFGRKYQNVVIKEDDVITSVEQKSRFKFFTWTEFRTEKNYLYKINAPMDKAIRAFNLQGLLPLPAPVKKGTVLARGYIETGDQVFVEKFSYHFFPPRRGEVFVFTTDTIRDISVNKAQGSIHYIKRLAGLPGDELRVDPEGKVHVNGEIGKEYGFKRVMSAENGYRGYQPQGLFSRRSPAYVYQSKVLLPPEKDEGQLGAGIPEGRYAAFGDNSYNSYDSRGWGSVPKDNLTGRALFVYWPFNSHWGIVR